MSSSSFAFCLLHKHLNRSVRCIVKDLKILSVMAAKRADQLIHDMIAEEAHRQWEAEKSQQMRTAWECELKRRQSLVQQRRTQELHKVGGFTILVILIIIIIIIIIIITHLRCSVVQ